MTGLALKLNAIHTLAVAAAVLFAGFAIRRRIPLLERYNIPPSLVGGLVLALTTLWLRQGAILAVDFDTVAQTPLMIAFFTTIGFGASISLLRAGGPLMVVFLLVSTVVAVAQNVLGLAIAVPLGEHPLLGVLAGSVTLTGGPGTGLAFGPEFERAGLPAATTAAVAAAMVGIVAGGLLGGPVGTALITRHRRRTGAESTREGDAANASVAPTDSPARGSVRATIDDATAYDLLKNIALILVAMGLGGVLSDWLSDYITLPGYIGAMIVAAAIRNLDDATAWFGSSQRVIDHIGTVVLSLFLTMALMTLRLWQLAALALPLTVILFAQVLLIAVIAATVVYRVVGRDYEAAVIATGFCGFMLGTTANAMANMEAITARYGPAPKAFLVVPMVGAFFIDFANALIITVFLNVWR